MPSLRTPLEVVAYASTFSAVSCRFPTSWLNTEVGLSPDSFTPFTRLTPVRLFFSFWRVFWVSTPQRVMVCFSVPSSPCDFLRFLVTLAPSAGVDVSLLSSKKPSKEPKMPYQSPFPLFSVILQRMPFAVAYCHETFGFSQFSLFFRDLGPLSFDGRIVLALKVSA